MKLNLLPFICITLTVGQYFPLEAGRRNPTEAAPSNAAIIYFSQEEKPVSVEYDVLQPSVGLHREALMAFHHEKYEHARACFSLGLKASPRSADLILNYALFSMVVPWMDGQSLTRAEGLLQLIEKEKDLQDPRYIIAKTLMGWLTSPQNANVQDLEAIDHPYFMKIASALKQQILSGQDIIDANWSKHLLPIRYAPREKRERR